MLKSYIKISWRNLIRHKAFSIINIGGLSIGIAACLLISLYVHYELSYDTYNLKKERIVRITSIMHTPESDNVNLALSPVLLAAELKHTYPGVETAVRVEPVNSVIKVKNQLFNEQFIYKTDTNVFDVFTFRFVEGNPSGALADPHSIVLTASLAKKYFGSDDPVGQNVTCNKQLYHVSAVMADLPENSDLKINALLPADFSKVTKWMEDDFSVYTFVLFKQKINSANFSNKLALIARNDIQPELNKMGAVKYWLKFNTEELKDVHFSPGNLGDTKKRRQTTGLYFFDIGLCYPVDCPAELR